MKWVFTIGLCTALCSCVSSRALAPTKSTTTAPALSALSPNVDVDAYVDPPVGWQAEPLKLSPKHKHQVWLSPSGHTAYGVIHFTLPLPIGHDLALRGFLKEMKRTEGEATLRDKQWDKNLGGLRFVADGGLYHVRVNLFVDGWHGWAVYAGAKQNEPFMPDEIALAEQARERTVVGLHDADRR